MLLHSFNNIGCCSIFFFFFKQMNFGATSSSKRWIKLFHRLKNKKSLKSDSHDSAVVERYWQHVTQLCHRGIDWRALWTSEQSRASRRFPNSVSVMSVGRGRCRDNDSVLVALQRGGDEREADCADEQQEDADLQHQGRPFRSARHFHIPPLSKYMRSRTCPFFISPHSVHMTFLSNWISVINKLAHRRLYQKITSSSLVIFLAAMTNAVISSRTIVTFIAYFFIACDGEC